MSANRIKARNLLNRIITSKVGLGLDDLPDTCLVCDCIDTLEEMIDNEESKESIIETAKEFAIEILEDEGMDFFE